MRKINKLKVNLMNVKDSITGKGGTATYSGRLTRFWVRPPTMSRREIEELYVLDDGEVPEPKEGWGYAGGFIV